jgi:hypothetical protein
MVGTSVNRRWDVPPLSYQGWFVDSSGLMNQRLQMRTRALVFPIRNNSK